MERRLAAILAADVVGYSRLMGANESGTLAALDSLRTDFINPKISQHQGRIVKLTGDGMLVEFPSVVNAVACATELQRSLRHRNADASQDHRIEFRIGVNVGDVIAQGEDIFGDGVNVAARLESVAPVGGIAVSQSVRDHIGKRLDLVFEDLGERQLKNIERPIRVYSISLDQPSPNEAANAVPAPHGPRPSIAVLPFVNMSGDPEQEYFSDGITEDIITDLSKVSGLFVVARNTAFTYKGKHVDVQEAAKRLGVNFILEGSVRKAGARVRVTGQLINGKDSGHIWADRYDRDLTDIFAIQDEITHAIVEQLKVKLLPQEKKSIAQAPTDNIEAYTFYLRGRQFMQRHSKSNYQLARRMFANAVELDPLYARAYAGIADCDSFSVPPLSFGGGDRHYSGHRWEGADSGRPTRRSACFARARVVTWATIRGSNGRIRKGNRAGPKFLRGPLFLWPRLRHTGEAGPGGHAFRAGGRKQARRLSIIVPADCRLPVTRPFGR